MGRTRLVVVGADAAGMSAAHHALRRARHHGIELEVVALERTNHTSYSACGIPYWVAGDLDTGEVLVARTARAHRAAGIDLRMGTEATQLDLDTGSLTARQVDTGQTEQIGFDQVLLATGAAAIAPPWSRAADGSWIPGVRTVKTLDDGAAWVETLESGPEVDGAGGTPPRRGVVVGGGYIGLEMAEAFVRRGLEVTLVTRNRVMSSLDVEQGERVQRALRDAGVQVLTGVEVEGLATGAGGRVRAVTLAAPDGRELPADVVAIGIGLHPRTELADAAGIALGEQHGLQPDPRQHVGGPVWAAGDCCEHLERHTGKRLFVPLGTHANKQGRIAGGNIVGDDDRFGGVLGTAVTRFEAGGVNLEIGRTGRSLEQARRDGADADCLLTESTTTSGYMPDAAPITITVVGHRGTGRLLGAQLTGGPGTAKRVDVAAAAIWAGLGVADVAGMDLGYAPPFSPVYDPLQIACRRLLERW